MPNEITEHLVRIKKVDEDKRIVYGEVYAPNTLDSHGEFMSVGDVEVMAHRFMKMAHMAASIDTMHDNVSNGCYPVESFIARAGDAEYTEGSWVLGTKIRDNSLWEDIKVGKINGYSFQALVKKLAVVVDIEVTLDKVGTTEPLKEDGHTHLYFVELSDEGKVLRGRTSIEDGHYHDIRSGTATEKANGHAHRIAIG